MCADEIDEPTVRQGNIVQYTSEINPVGHDEQPGESFREVTQIIQVHRQLTEEDLTGGGSVGSAVSLYGSSYAP